MSGVTSIISPGKDSEVLLFSINTNLYVSLAAKKATDSKDTIASFGTQTATADGPMLKDSTLASLRQDDLATVYGVVTRTVNNGTTTSTIAEVALISPVYQPLGLYSDDTYGRIATTLRPEDDGTNTAFLYYRKPNELATIYEYPLWDENPNETSYSPNKVGKATYLTSYYNTEKSSRHIIFQEDDGAVHDYNITDDSREKISPVTDAIDATPLAAAWRADTSEVYLYYSTKVQGKYKLRRVINSAGSWGSPSFPSKAQDLNPKAQLSVTPTEKSGHVFYEGAKGGFQHYIDKW